MRCAICKGENIKLLYSNKDQFLYTQGVCTNGEDDRLCITRELNYYYCEQCGYIFNPNPITSEDDDWYKEYYALNPQDLSEKDRKNLNDIVDLIIKNINIKGRILEIGSNDGYFLNLFKIKGYDCTGIDPSPSVEISKKKYPAIEVIKDYYHPNYFKNKFDLIISRNVIEHLEKPINFLFSIKESLNEKGFVYFEVPNVIKTLQNKIYSNFYHEHISYFDKKLFEKITKSLGFKTIFIANINDDDVIAYIGQNVKNIQEFQIKELPDSRKLVEDIEFFKKHFEKFKQKIKKFLKSLIVKKVKIGIWGAGCTAINILSYSIELGYNNYFLFDSSPTKIKKYLPGFGKIINSPDKIQKLEPYIMIIMSERYIEEIHNSLKEMKFSGEIWALFPDIIKLN